MGLTPEQLMAVKAVRDFLEHREEEELYDGSLEQAKRLADECTEVTGVQCMVIRLGNRYDWVTKYYFNTYEHKGKIYYKSKDD